ncbi:MAG: HK97 family phage prohead protease [Pseudomonadota bacterium]
MAVLSDGGRTGRPRKERFASRSFGYRIDRPDEDVHLLIGHDFNRPLASRGTGTLDIRDGDDAVTIEATIAPALEDVGYVRDALALLQSGLAVGLSPGFRLPPKRAVAEPETLEDEPHDPERGMHRAIIRTITAALLYELSVVTRPAYEEAAVEEARAGLIVPVRRIHSSARWR